MKSAAKQPVRNRHAKGGQGQHWVSDKKRLGLYLRDGLACCYCGEGIENEAKLTLDHLRPYASGGSNAATNLATACLRCNASRGKRSWKLFAADVARYINHDVTAADIISHIETTRKRPVDVEAAKEMIARRGGFSAALAKARKV